MIVKICSRINFREPPADRSLIMYNIIVNPLARKTITLIFLVGLVTKTGILLVDYANVLRARGLDLEEAVREAALTRFRPVVMTASSSVLGMLPIALGYGAGGNARAPMGVVIALGNFVSTALTLLVIPVAYVLLSRLQEFLAGRRRLLLWLTLAVAVSGAAAATLWWW